MSKFSKKALVVGGVLTGIAAAVGVLSKNKTARDKVKSLVKDNEKVNKGISLGKIAVKNLLDAKNGKKKGKAVEGEGKTSGNVEVNKVEDEVKKEDGVSKTIEIKDDEVQKEEEKKEDNNGK